MENSVIKVKKKSSAKPIKTKESKIEALTCSWTIRGISLEARSAAHKAADRAHEFTGSWVSRNLLEAAQRELTASREVARPEDTTGQAVFEAIATVTDKMSEEMKKLSDKIDYLSKRRSFLMRWLQD